MLINGMNDSEEALRDIAEALSEIQPDRVHITLPDRPPSESWVKPPGRDKLLLANEILKDCAYIEDMVEGDFVLSPADNTVVAIEEIIARHPMEEREIKQTLKNLVPDRIEEILALLASSKKVQVVERSGRRYWSSSDCYYPE